MNELDYSPLTPTKPVNLGRLYIMIVILALIIFLVLFLIPDQATLLASVGLLIIVKYSASKSAQVERMKLAKMDHFASINHMGFVSDGEITYKPGIIFNSGNPTTVTSAYIASNRSFSEIGNITYVVGSGKNRREYDFGYIEIKLPKRLPNIVLDSTKNNQLGILSNLPNFVPGGQKLELEGDFNNYFTVHVPEGYERDALEIFTPEVMQLLVDNLHNFDCEIIDDSLYLYSNDTFSLWEADELRQLINIADVVNAKFDTKVAKYADYRIGDQSINVVAKSGQRLKQFFGLSSVWNIVIYLVVAMFFLQPVLVLLVDYLIKLF